MGQNSDKRPGLSGKGRGFETTQWSLIIEAQKTLNPGYQVALQDLCQRYWFPVYSFIRRNGHSVAEAEDLTQGFFAHLLEKKTLKAADPNRGRFRSFLLTSVKYFLADQWDKRSAQKRGGGIIPMQLDFEHGEARYLEPGQDVTPETLFEQQWAYTVLDEVMEQLRQESAAQGLSETFNALRGFLTGVPEAPQGEIAEKLGISHGALRVRVHRMRKRFGILLRQRIATTLEDISEVDDEIRYLMGILSQ